MRWPAQVMPVVIADDIDRTLIALTARPMSLRRRPVMRSTRLGRVRMAAGFLAGAVIAVTIMLLTCARIPLPVVAPLMAVVVTLTITRLLDTMARPLALIVPGQC